MYLRKRAERHSDLPLAGISGNALKVTAKYRSQGIFGNALNVTATYGWSKTLLPLSRRGRMAEGIPFCIITSLPPRVAACPVQILLIVPTDMTEPEMRANAGRSRHQTISHHDL